MRIACYNVEWFTALFDRRGRILEDAGESGRYGVTRAEQLGALGIVFTALDADCIVIVEAPDDNTRRKTVPMLEAFAAKFGLRQRRAVMGFANDTQQEIAALYDPEVLRLSHDPAEGSATAPRFDRSLKIDLDVDDRLDTVRFSKPPLEVQLEVLTGPAAGRRLRLIGVHLKSKAPHGANDPAAEVRLGIENRRKQLAQCLWLRRRVDDVLDAGESLIVLGDFNDGPGLDEYEALFGRSGLEIVLGTGGPPARQLHDPHARLPRGKTTALPASARFFIPEPPPGRFLSAMLDYIALSPDLCAHAPKWRIWHPFDDPGCYQLADLREALLQASDHFPVSVDLAL
ncbi:endonuclease [Rhodobacter capsulatus]|uniref:endonuclease/exonuclease/phosphatase family protein n=1 Tax=Rhodobacter capsulatus TaxID=1061 RepID=UPI0006DC69EB|nr:endonuclease/exonuclease/phosphatase family protein [Rhodobacter capsulatus]KQB11528.1 endonuclease [Rhodobacter capsulatus]KQB12381.1 endonuclease [Rhodobacter capsulatus]PZX25755.1 Endonuclease/Exonuclease/phosphatase family protein [Rhodobacter capsulatus]QNR64057.1 endonuclease [Rhodobacter capsulatus]